MSKQQTRVIAVNDEELSVHGQRVQTQPDSFSSCYTGHKTTTESLQQAGMTAKSRNSTTVLSKSSTRDNDKQISNENSSSRWYHQVSRNVNESAKKNQMTTSFSLPMEIPIEPYRSPTAPLVREENTRRSISTRIKSNMPSHSSNLRVIDLSDSFDHFSNSTIFSSKSTTSENDNAFVQRSSIDTSNRDRFLHTPVLTKPCEETVRTTTTTGSDQNEFKILRRNSQSKINGYQHIVNLGSWQRSGKSRSENFHEMENEDDLSQERIDEYKNPFSEEYDQAIASQAQLTMNNTTNEWNLKDFYRDVKTPFEPETNTKFVFEKCLKLSRLQANTIKWEKNRRQNLTIYNRLLKNATLENNSLNPNGNLPPNLAELKRELRCNECKRITCLGNCAPGQEYRQYKRLMPISSVPTSREPIRSKANIRPQRSMFEIRPRSQQTTRVEQTNFNSVVVVPLFADDSKTKSPPKKFTHGDLPGRSFRSQRGETLALISSHKVLS